jgi:hypothetical protein
MMKLNAHHIREILATLQDRSPTLLSKNPKIKVYTIIVLPVLYGYEHWFFTLRKEHESSVFASRVLRRVFGPKREEVTDDAEIE